MLQKGTHFGYTLPRVFSAYGKAAVQHVAGCCCLLLLFWKACEALDLVRKCGVGAACSSVAVHQSLWDHPVLVCVWLLCSLACTLCSLIGCQFVSLTSHTQHGLLYQLPGVLTDSLLVLACPSQCLSSALEAGMASSQNLGILEKLNGTRSSFEVVLLLASHDSVTATCTDVCHLVQPCS